MLGTSTAVWPVRAAGGVPAGASCAQARLLRSKRATSLCSASALRPPTRSRASSAQGPSAAPLTPTVSLALGPAVTAPCHCCHSAALRRLRCTWSSDSEPCAPEAAAVDASAPIEPGWEGKGWKGKREIEADAQAEGEAEGRGGGRDTGRVTGRGRGTGTSTGKGRGRQRQKPRAAEGGGCLARSPAAQEKSAGNALEYFSLHINPRPKYSK
eukprot:scaffold194308_cov30-Tisochrysis_lutea.AAC.4